MEDVMQPPADSLEELAEEELTEEAVMAMMDSHSTTNIIEAMKKQMLDDTYVFSGIAILGQSTVIYAAPNTGKTLLSMFLLQESIDNGCIATPKLITYVNADDDFNGIQIKSTIAADSHYKMWSPGHKGITIQIIMKCIQELITRNGARNTVFILDTLKKFTDPMNKKASSDFSQIIRNFTSKGGTVIMLAHVNKNKSWDGESVPAGTSDILDDCDCAYVLETIDDSPVKVIELRNKKSRGAVESKVSFSYDTTEKNYPELLKTVKRLTKADLTIVKEAKARIKYIAKYQKLITLLSSCLYTTSVSTKELICVCKLLHISGEKSVRNVLKTLEGSHWIESIGDKNAKGYTAIKVTPPPESNTLQFVIPTQTVTIGGQTSICRSSAKPTQTTEG